jgi:anti-sigma-K factor RskA
MSTDIHALAGAYALDAVDDLERVAFSRHLAECETCRTDVDEMREAAARLADGTWSVPPPGLRPDVLAAIRRTRQLSPGAPAPAERDPGAVLSRWRRFTAGAAAAGILAVGAGAATYAVQEQRVRDQRMIAAAATAKEQRTQAILAAPDVQMRTAVLSGGGRVTVAMAPSQHAGVVMMAATSAPPAGKVFQLWLIDNATGPADAGVMAAGQSSGVQIVDGMPDSDAFGVTVEPVGGSATPTLPTVAAITLT